jgi:c-di-GMP-binding flagellar brake protein YcgR
MDRKDKEKREFSRGALQVSARCRLKKSQIKCYMTNLSEGGCQIYCYSATAVRSGSKIEISFNLNNAEEDFVVSGTVVRAMPFNRGARDINRSLGIRFTDLTEKQKKAIGNFIKRYLSDMRRDRPVSV